MESGLQRRRLVQRFGNGHSSYCPVLVVDKLNVGVTTTTTLVNVLPSVNVVAAVTFRTIKTSNNNLSVGHLILFWFPLSASSVDEDILFIINLTIRLLPFLRVQPRV